MGNNPIIATRAFQSGENVFLRFTVTDNDPESPTFGELINVATALIEVTDSTGVAIVTAQPMTNTATGVYRYDYDSTGSAETGDYIAEATFTLAGRITLSRLCFTIEP